MLPLFIFRELNLPLRHGPGMVVIFCVEYTAAPKPVVIAVVVHPIAKPGRREHFGLFSGSLRLRFLRFLDAGTDKVGALQQCVGIYLYFIGKAFTQFLVGIRCPDDVLFC